MVVFFWLYLNPYLDSSSGYDITFWRAFVSGLPACVNTLIDPNKPYGRSTNVAV